MKPLRLFSSRINNKLMLLSIIPIAVVTVVLTWYTIETRRSELVQYQRETAQQLTKNLAKISDFALYSGRRDILGPLANSALQIPSINGIYFLSPERKIVLSREEQKGNLLSEESLQNALYDTHSTDILVVEEPVYLQDTEISDYDGPPPSTGEKTLLGWVVLVADQSNLVKKTQEILVTHMLISFAVLICAIVLTYLLSHHVVAPIMEMTQVVGELEKGNLDTRIEPRTGDELSILAHGINHLARAVAESRDNLEHKIVLATGQLTQTLEDLRGKNIELEEARRHAETASAAKGDFLAQMSHELRTPITAIQGFVKLLNTSELTTIQQRYCAIIQQASSQLLQLIDDILDINRLQSNAISLENLPFKLADCLETPVSLMAPIAHQKGLELILDITPEVPFRLLGDSLRIRQIIYNLLSNAIKFTASGHVAVKVSSHAAGPHRVELYIQVLDTGMGIPAKKQPGLFEPFAQADTSISRRFGGSGLGLSIVKHLVDIMGGSIRLHSAAGKGTIFTLCLPLDLPPESVDSPAPQLHKAIILDPLPLSRQAIEHRLSRYVEVIESCESIADLDIGDRFSPPQAIVYSQPQGQSVEELMTEIAELRTRFQCPIALFSSEAVSLQGQIGNVLADWQPIWILNKPVIISELENLFSNQGRSLDSRSRSPFAISDKHTHILAAEDNELTRLLLIELFDDSHCQLSLAINGREAISKCDDQRFDLILMDLHMPEVDGIEALRAIRRGNGPNKNTPVVILTADILQQEESALFEAGASDLIFKPIDEVKLYACLHRHLDGAQPPIKISSETKVDAENHKKQLFSEEMSRLTHWAKQSLDHRQEEELKEAIHQLLGIAGVYGITLLERAVRSLSEAVKAKDTNKINAAMDNLLVEVENLDLDTIQTS